MWLFDELINSRDPLTTFDIVAVAAAVVVEAAC